MQSFYFCVLNLLFVYFFVLRFVCLFVFSFAVLVAVASSDLKVSIIFQRHQFRLITENGKVNNRKSEVGIPVP